MDEMRLTTVAFEITDDRLTASTGLLAERVEGLLRSHFQDLMIRRLDRKSVPDLIALTDLVGGCRRGGPRMDLTRHSGGDERG